VLCQKPGVGPEPPPEIVNVAALDVPPPGEGLKTVTLADPADPISPALILAVSCVLLTYDVVRSLPFQRSTEPFTKSVFPTWRETGLDKA
jgi:hypothetical protein